MWLQFALVGALLSSGVQDESGAGVAPPPPVDELGDGAPEDPLPGDEGEGGEGHGSDPAESGPSAQPPPSEASPSPDDQPGYEVAPSTRKAPADERAARQGPTDDLPPADDESSAALLSSEPGPELYAYAALGAGGAALATAVPAAVLLGGLMVTGVVNPALGFNLGVAGFLLSMGALWLGTTAAVAAAAAVGVWVAGEPHAWDEGKHVGCCTACVATGPIACVLCGVASFMAPNVRCSVDPRVVSDSLNIFSPKAWVPAVAIPVATLVGGTAGFLLSLAVISAAYPAAAAVSPGVGALVGTGFWLGPVLGVGVAGGAAAALSVPLGMWMGRGWAPAPDEEEKPKRKKKRRSRRRDDDDEYEDDEYEEDYDDQGSDDRRYDEYEDDRDDRDDRRRRDRRRDRYDDEDDDHRARY